MSRERKILVIGSPGAGKSTFARKLRDKTGLPLWYLDQLFHNPDRTTVSREIFDGRLREILEKPEWIIDGNYARTMPLRFERCTEVFFLDYPADVCLAGAAARLGKTHEDLPWTEETLDEEFRQFILDFPHSQRPEITELIERYKDSRTITVFASREEAESWLQNE